MKVIDQNSAAAALEKALIPGPGLIDGRTEKERLDFLCRFATLINFYDKNNQLNGNWQPFLLKDPVFLLASMSQTDYRKEHRLFVQTCASLQELIDEQKDDAQDDRSTDTEIQEEIVTLFNQLFDQLTRVFLKIENWTYYMQMGSEEYDLKKYVIDQVKQTYSSYLWAMFSLRNFMASSQVLSADTKNQIHPVQQYVLDQFTDLIWTRDAGNTPFMQVLGLYPISELNEANDAEEPSVSGPIPSGITITTQGYFNGLKYVGEQLFKFYRTIVHHAGPEYEKEKLKKSSYPDTLLLRTFSDLLKVQQEQLNQVANKHLHFYYTGILKQTEQPAVADSVFIAIVLGKNTTVFDLPAGSQFNAGMDADKNPIVFASDEEVSLNAAVVSAVYTLTPLMPESITAVVNTPQLFLQSIAKPGVVATDENGQTLSWDTFGGTTNIDSTAATTAQMGFSFGSPMLYLPEGTRQITINLGFESLPAASVFNGAQLFLSSATAWVPVTYTFLATSPSTPNTLSIQIVLDSTQPPIVPFTKSPDTVWSTWPMFKVVLDSFSGLAIPPVLTSIGIDVCVTGVNTLALYNDNGLLSTKTPFQLFGPIVNLNSNFLIGSNEIFSKPLNWLSIEIDWDALPQPSSTPLTPTPLDNGFGTYYNSYNAILFPGITAPTPPDTLKSLTIQANYNPPIQSPDTGTTVTTTTTTTTTTKSPEAETTPEKTPSRTGKFFRKVWNVIKWPVTSIAGLFSGKKTKPKTSSTSRVTTSTSTPVAAFVPPAPPAAAQSVPFANIYFTVGFSMLNYSAWDTFFMYNYGGNANYATWLNSPCSSAPVWPDGTAIDFQLFDTSSGNLATKSVFGYFKSQYDPPAETDPTIQQTTLTYDGTNASGFIKMTLTNPANGFGPSVYGAVVTDIVTQNAVAISKPRWPWSTDPTILAAANVPFAPKVTAISAMYSASQVYDVTQNTESYPLQYYYYTPFASYTAYDNSSTIEENYSVDISMIGDPGKITGLQLVPSFTSNAGHRVLACDGAMYIGMTGLVPANPISFFFELSTTYTAPTSGAEVNYYYLSTKGWKALPLLNDGTNNFTCSGIITLNIPADITNNAACMPADTYWIAIGASIDSTTPLDLSSFAQVVLLAPNGVELTRTGTAYLTDTTAPVISSGAITKPQTAIPEIGTVAQPFASFGGRAAEDQEQMYVRVSRRLKTKDRAVSGNDIFTLISQQFPDIYFSATVFTPDTNLTNVYVVEGFDSYTDANAYRPYVSECEMEKISDFLQQRVSLFSNITVSNYAFQYVTVTAHVTVQAGYVPEAMSASIAQALNIFLSPWIANSGQEQCIIGQPITGSQVAAFIRSIAGIATVTGIELSSAGPVTATNVQTLTPAPGTLFVSSLDHTINTRLVT